MKEVKDIFVFMAGICIGVMVSIVSFTIFDELTMEEKKIDIDFEDDVLPKILEDNCKVVYKLQNGEEYTTENMSWCELIKEGYIDCDGTNLNVSFHKERLNDLGWNETENYGLGIYTTYCNITIGDTWKYATSNHTKPLRTQE